jgi:hypothetical protein
MVHDPRSQAPIQSKQFQEQHGVMQRISRGAFQKQPMKPYSAAFKIFDFGVGGRPGRNMNVISGRSSGYGERQTM